MFGKFEPVIATESGRGATASPTRLDGQDLTVAQRGATNATTLAPERRTAGPSVMARRLSGPLGARDQERDLAR
jgi:hypothetical protein